MQAISDEIGVSLRTLKDHRARGLINPDSLTSVMLYGSSVLNRRMAAEVGYEEDEA